ncbi:hypothetical protein U0070_025360 [Myodes glareolus]|uniref:dual-specificity kinase n=1 Tax=Myodes glareolus TaxID=447135 RepID=A0AAW0JMR3_MYOGA
MSIFKDPSVVMSPLAFAEACSWHHVEQAGFKPTYIAKADFELLLPLLYLLKVGIAKIRNTRHHVFMGYCGSNERGSERERDGESSIWTHMYHSTHMEIRGPLLGATSPGTGRFPVMDVKGFNTHENRDHLVMMEKTLGPISSHMIHRTRKQKYFYKVSLVWDENSSDGRSRMLCLGEFYKRSKKSELIVDTDVRYSEPGGGKRYPGIPTSSSLLRAFFQSKYSVTCPDAWNGDCFGYPGFFAFPYEVEYCSFKVYFVTELKPGPKEVLAQAYYLGGPRPMPGPTAISGSCKLLQSSQILDQTHRGITMRLERTSQVWKRMLFTSLHKKEAEEQGILDAEETETGIRTLSSFPMKGLDQMIQKAPLARIVLNIKSKCDFGFLVKKSRVLREDDLLKSFGHI